MSSEHSKELWLQWHHDAKVSFTPGLMEDRPAATHQWARTLPVKKSAISYQSKKKKKKKLFLINKASALKYSQLKSTKGTQGIKETIRTIFSKTWTMALPWRSSGWDAMLLLQRAWILSLVGDLRSCMPHGMAKNRTQKQRNKKPRIILNELVIFRSAGSKNQNVVRQ